MKLGWVAGAGFETPLQAGWNVGAEYLFVSFGRVAGTGRLLTSNVTPSDTFGHSLDLQSHIGRLRLNYKY